VWGTPTENAADTIRHGKQIRGSKHHQSKLSPKQVNELRYLREKGWLLRELADRYGISITAAANIVNGKVWKEVA